MLFLNAFAHGFDLVKVCSIFWALYLSNYLHMSKFESWLSSMFEILNLYKSCDIGQIYNPESLGFISDLLKFWIKTCFSHSWWSWGKFSWLFSLICIYLLCLFFQIFVISIFRVACFCAYEVVLPIFCSSSPKLHMQGLILLAYVVECKIPFLRERWVHFSLTYECKLKPHHYAFRVNSIWLLYGWRRISHMLAGYIVWFTPI